MIGSIQRYLGPFVAALLTFSALVGAVNNIQSNPDLSLVLFIVAGFTLLTTALLYVQLAGRKNHPVPRFSTLIRGGVLVMYILILLIATLIWGEPVQDWVRSVVQRGASPTPIIGIVPSSNSISTDTSTLTNTPDIPAQLPTIPPSDTPTTTNTPTSTPSLTFTPTPTDTPTITNTPMPSPTATPVTIMMSSPTAPPACEDHTQDPAPINYYFNLEEGEIVYIAASGWEGRSTGGYFIMITGPYQNTLKIYNGAWCAPAQRDSSEELIRRSYVESICSYIEGCDSSDLSELS